MMIRGLVGFVLIFSASVLHAETWEHLHGTEALSALFTDTVLTAELGRGARAVANYNADGTGELKAWGDTFAREWKIDKDEVCIRIDGRFQCWRIERNAENTDEFRGTKVTTGEQVVFTVTDQETALTAGSGKSAGGAAQPSAEEMAQKLANPTNPIMTIGNNFDYVTFKGELPGAKDQSSFRYLFQTVFPLKLRDEKGTVFFRPAIPVFFNEPVPNGDSDFDSKGVELGDIGFDLSWGTTSESGWIYGGGMVGLLPTATDDALGKDKWALGPEGLFGKVGSWGAVLGLLTHQWDVGGSGEADIDVTSFTYVYAFGLGGGWQIAASPVVTYDHTAANGNELTLPLGIGLAKTAILAGRPWKFQVQYWNYIESNDAFAPEHLLRLSISPVVSAPWNNGR